MNRTCKNCGIAVERNPQAKKRRWLHTATGMRKCSDGSGQIADAAPLSVPDDVTMLVVGTYPVWYRESFFYKDGNSDLWSNMRMGSSPKTTTELLEDANLREIDVYSLGRLEKLS